MRQTKSRQAIIVVCRFIIKKSAIVSRKSAVKMSFFAFLLACILLGGCSAVSPWANAERPYYEERLSAPYDQMKTKESIILDAVPKIQRKGSELDLSFAEGELISHSENVVASLGQSKDGFKTWFNMVTFHENKLNVTRKYFFFVDDKAKIFQPSTGRGLRFDCEMVMAREEVSGPDTPENARRIATLRKVLDNLHNDVDELNTNTGRPNQENKTLDICRMLINQTFEQIFVKLNNSPVLATRLNEAGGVEFNHINFDKGTIQMVVAGDIVKVKIRLGAFVGREETPQPIKPTQLKRAGPKPSSVYRPW